MKDSKLTHTWPSTAKSLWLVYAAVACACVIALKIAGMSWFDAVCHAFAAMGLGGFSTHDASVGSLNSPVIEAVLIFFMLVAAIDFATHFLAYRSRSLHVYRTRSEAFPMLGVVMSCIGVALYIWQAAPIPVTGLPCAMSVSIWCRWRQTVVLPAPSFISGRFCAAVDVVSQLRDCEFRVDRRRH